MGALAALERPSWWDSSIWRRSRRPSRGQLRDRAAAALGHTQTAHACRRVFRRDDLELIRSPPTGRSSTADRVVSPCRPRDHQAIQRTRGATHAPVEFAAERRMAELICEPRLHVATIGAHPVPNFVHWPLQVALLRERALGGTTSYELRPQERNEVS